jgi:SagB-type dehydrogenase family enzyme
MKKRNQINQWFIIGCLLGGEILAMTLTAKNKTIQLPPPKTKGTVSIEEAIAGRKSIRTFLEYSLTLQELSQLLWASQGITHDDWKRAAPSAGATYPFEVYVAVRGVVGLEPGLYHYLHQKHELEMVRGGDLSKDLRTACYDQLFIEKAAVNIILAAKYERTTKRYGDRGIRYVHMEAGHIGENISLQVVALGLGTVAVGAFSDEKVKALLAIEEEPLYIFPVGRP